MKTPNDKQNQKAKSKSKMKNKNAKAIWKIELNKQYEQGK